MSDTVVQAPVHHDTTHHAPAHHDITHHHPSHHHHHHHHHQNQHHNHHHPGHHHSGDDDTPPPPAPAMHTGDVFLIIIALLFPPLPVWVKRGLCSCDSFINILLCCLGVLPGLLHAWYIVCAYPDPQHAYSDLADPERGRSGERVTYYYVQPPVHRAQQQQQQQQQQQRSYGTTTAPAQGGSSQAGGEGAPPPPYSEAIKGDNKIQH